MRNRSSFQASVSRASRGEGRTGRGWEAEVLEQRAPQAAAAPVSPRRGGHAALAAAGFTEIVSLSTYLIELQMSFLMAIW